MNKQKYTSFMVDTVSKMAAWRLTAGLMLVSNLLLVIYMFNVSTAEKTIIVPPNIERPFTVRGDEVSPEYVEQMTQYFSQQLLTYQKKNARHRFESVLHYAAPRQYAVMRATFDNEARRIERNDIASVFYPMGISIDRLTAVIHGELVGMVGSRVVSRKDKAYRFQYQYQGGHFSVVSFTEVRKDPAGHLIEVEPEPEPEMVGSPSATQASRQPVPEYEEQL